MSDAPPVRFVTTADGVRIAYMLFPGEGVPWLRVRSSGAVPMVQEHNLVRGHVGAHDLARGRPYLLFDWRGTGQSDRTLAMSMDDLVSDITAVTGTLKEKPDVWASTGACLAACSFAARNPDAWRSLTLTDPMVRFSDSPQGTVLRPGWEPDYESYLESLTRNFFPQSVPADEVKQFARAWQEAVPVEAHQAFRSFDYEFDLTDTLPNVTLPVLVTKGLWGSKAAAVAALLPNAVLLERSPGDSNVQLREAWDRTIGAAFASDLDRPGAVSELTVRESEVLRLMAAGASNRDIAGKLTLSTRTVERHVANVYDKIGVHSRAGAVRWALDHGVG